jgi:MYXO-CTERM domain-containing protein
MRPGLVLLSFVPLLLVMAPSAARAGCGDGDGDGFADEACGGDDCDDGEPTTWPGAPEACDGVDSDCDGTDDDQDTDVGALVGPTITPSSTVFASWPDAGARSEIIVVAGVPGPITDVDVQLWLLPSFADHTSVSLASPAGTTVLLFEGIGQVGDDFQETTLDDEAPTAIGDGVGDFEDVYVPMEALSAFDGEDPNGEWTMTVTDTVPNFAGGIFNTWGLDLETLQPDDADGDGFIDGCGDCDPTDDTVFPGALESCNDGVDQDCDGADTDGDFDGDGFVDDGDSDGADYCVDCDDDDATSFPGAAEVCDDGLDQDCDGDDLASDFDGDGALAIDCGGDDCDDFDAGATPGFDNDGDGSDSCEDCDDHEALSTPGRVEDCDGLDNDCDGVTDEDSDGDAWTVCLDCDDADPTVFPGADEVCDDGVDQDCDGDDAPCGDDDDSAADDDDSAIDDDDDSGDDDDSATTDDDDAADDDDSGDDDDSAPAPPVDCACAAAATPAASGVTLALLLALAGLLRRRTHR